MRVLGYAVFTIKCKTKLTPSFVSDPDLILSEARALDRVPHYQKDRLHGIAIAITDIMDTKGLLSLALPAGLATLLTLSIHATLRHVSHSPSL